MKKIILLALLSVGLFANTQPYKKEIVLDEIIKPTLVQVELDNEIYKNTAYDYRDIRLKSQRGVEGYFIKSLSKDHIVNNKTLTATSYDREKAKLTYKFKKPFEIEKIKLNIEDRNFESTVDVYADGKLLLKNQKVFDYSNETGNQNFVLKIPKVKVKKITVVYHLDQTTSFYKKYQNLREMSKYLTIKSVTFSNFNKAKNVFNKTEIKLERSSVDENKKETCYVFKTNDVPFSKIVVNFKEENFKRSGQLYVSADAEKWQSFKSFSLLSSTLNQQSHKNILVNARTKYLKLVLYNADNKPLNIENIELFTTPTYLYFIANPNEAYTLYFGDKNLTNPSYELKSLVSANDLAMKATFSKLEALDVTKVVDEVSFFEEYKEYVFMVAILLALIVLGYVAFGLLGRFGNTEH